MRRPKRPRGRGFALIELLAVLMMIGIIATITVPAFQRLIHRTRVMSSLTRITSVMQIARLEAVRRGVPTVVTLDAVNRQLVAFADIDGAAPGTAPDGLFNPLDPAPPRGTDFEIRRVPVPSVLAIEDPDGNAGTDSIDGFVNPGAMPDGVLIFQPNGSVMATGAMRFSDGRSNYLEVAVAPAASGRARLRKYHAEWEVNPDDGSHWYAQGEIQRNWVWD